MADLTLPYVFVPFATVKSAENNANMQRLLDGVNTGSPLIPDGRTYPGTLKEYLENNAQYNIADYGANLDGTDDSAAFNRAIAAAILSPSGSGTVTVPIGATVGVNGNVVQLAPNVSIVGSFSGRPGAKIVQLTPGTMFDSPVSRSDHMAVAGLELVGFGAVGAGVGVRFRSGYWCAAERLLVHNFADAGVQADAGTTSNWFNRIIAYSCVLNRGQVAVVGAMDISGTDHMIWGIESTASVWLNAASVVTSVNLYCVSFAAKCSNAFITDCQCETSDVGLYVSGSYNRFNNIRADTNCGHGIMVVSGANQFNSPYCMNNSMSAANTYDHIYVSGTNNDFTSAKGDNQTATRVARYFINDVSAAGDVNKNYYVNPRMSPGYANGTGDYITGASGAVFSFPDGPPKLLTVNSATPAVPGYKHFLTANTLATTITNFTNGVNGQIIYVQGGDALTTIQNNATISLRGAVDLIMTSGLVYAFRRRAGVWEQFDSSGAAANEVAASGVSPRFSWYASGAALDEKRWDLLNSAGVLQFRTLKDDQSAANVVLRMQRVGYVPNVIEANIKVRPMVDAVYDLGEAALSWRDFFALGLHLREGANMTMGLAVLVAGSKVVNTTKVTANSRIFILSNVDGGAPGWLRVSARVAGTSFTITSSSGTDTSSVAWLIVEPS